MSEFSLIEARNRSSISPLTHAAFLTGVGALLLAFGAYFAGFGD